METSAITLLKSVLIHVLYSIDIKAWVSVFFLRAQGERRPFQTKRAQGERERKTRSFLRSLLGHSVDLEMQYFAAFCISKLPTMLPIIWISFKIHVKEYSSFAASLKCNYMLVIFPTTRYMRKLLKNEERRSFDAERKRVLFFSHASASSSAHVSFFGKERERSDSKPWMFVLCSYVQENEHPRLCSDWHIAGPIFLASSLFLCSWTFQSRRTLVQYVIISFIIFFFSKPHRSGLGPRSIILNNKI